MTADRPAPGRVRVIISDGDRYATMDVERHHLDGWPEVSVSTVAALLAVLDHTRLPSSRTR